MECKKCKKDSSVLCICGVCPKCNGTEEIMKMQFDAIMKKEISRIHDVASRNRKYDQEWYKKKLSVLKGKEKK